MIIHMEIETAYEYLQRIERHLEAWEELLSRVEVTRRRLQGAWEAPNAFTFLDELDGAVRLGRSGLMAARENHARAQNEHRQWVAVMEHYEFRPGFVRIAEWLHPLAEDGKTVKDYVEAISGVGKSVLVAVGVASFSEKEMAKWGLGGPLFAARRRILKAVFPETKEAVEEIVQKKVWVGHLLPNAKEALGETFGKDMSLREWGGLLNFGTELAEEIPENWHQYHGDPVKFLVSTAAETAAGMVSGAAVSAAGAAVGTAVGGAIGGVIGGPVGAAIGAHFGEALGPIAAQWVTEHVKIGGHSVDEWLETGGEMMGRAAVSVAEWDIREVSVGFHFVQKGITAVARLFS